MSRESGSHDLESPEPDLEILTEHQLSNGPHQRVLTLVDKC